jgi:hypothetical protein
MTDTTLEVEPLYGQRYCAFVDILGFRQLVAGLGNDVAKVNSLKHALTTIRDQPRQAGPALFMHTDFRTQSISDAVVISVAANVAALSELLISLTTLATRLLIEGYFVRGAITKGLLYHDDSMAFGEALLTAYHYEQTIVRYPRIMVLSDVVIDTQQLDHLPTVFGSAFKQADDGPMFLHILRKMQADMKALPLGPNNEEIHALADYHKMKDMIDKRYREAIDTPRHFEKVQWFAKYWNASLPGNATSFRVLGVGL